MGLLFFAYHVKNSVDKCGYNSELSGASEFGSLLRDLINLTCQI